MALEARKGHRLIGLNDTNADDGKRGYEGSLGVPGANEDSERIAEMIRENMDSIDEIYVSLDTHMKYHIAHPTFWENKDGKNPSPFTVITKKEVIGKYFTMGPASACA